MLSKDGKLKIRFDYENPGKDRPHAHIEVFVNGKWRDATAEHRIYFDARIDGGKSSIEQGKADVIPKKSD